MEKVKITTEYIKLDQFLKFTGIAENGSHAKDIIIFDEVYVNDVIEKRRGRKLYKDYVIKFNNKEFIVD